MLTNLLMFCFSDTDINIPGAEGAMAIARAINEHFSSSSQDLEKLIALQENGTISRYRDQKKGVKPIQDVVTRWWSTYRMCKRLRWLRPAIMALSISNQVQCAVLSTKQWEILHQIEIALQTMAGFQRMLEGDSYVTGSLVPMAVYRIRQSYISTLASKDVHQAVKDLTKILLADFNVRYETAGDGGQVGYSGDAVCGRYNRYTGAHPYFFVASFLDMRIRDRPYSENLAEESIMTEDGYMQLKEDILKIMVMEVKDKNAEKDGEPPEDEQTRKNESACDPALVAHGQTNTEHLFWGNMARVNTVIKTRAVVDDTTIVLDCANEMECYLMSEGLAIKDSEGVYVDPLQWWAKTRRFTLFLHA